MLEAWKLETGGVQLTSTWLQLMRIIFESLSAMTPGKRGRQIVDLHFWSRLMLFSYTSESHLH